jgi:hypothetical protein
MTTDQPTDNPQVEHEESDVDVAAILKAGLALLLSAVVIHLVVWGVLLFLDARQPTATDFPVAAGEERRPPAPRLQVAPRSEMQQIREQQQRTLSSYGWIDRERGLVRIPIDVAKRLTLERGLPVGSGTPAPAAGSAPSAP